MKLIRAWLAICAGCGVSTSIYNTESNITQDRAARSARAGGWSDTKDGLLCPDCNAEHKTRQKDRFVEVVKALKSAGSGDDC